MNGKALAGLRKVLVELYPDKVSIRRIVSDSDLESSRIDFDSTPVNIWQSVLEEAQRNNQIENLLRVVEEEYEDNPKLQEAVGVYHNARESTLVHLPSKLGENQQHFPGRSHKSEFLPALVNRGEQISRFKETVIRQPHRPITYILCGLESDRHDLFIQRIEKYELGGSPSKGVSNQRVIHQEPQRFYLPWSSIDSDTMSLHEKICQELRGHLSGHFWQQTDMSAESQDLDMQMRTLNAYMNEHLKVPLLIDTWITIENWDRYEHQKIRDFVRFWRGWASLEQPFPFLIIFLCIKFVDRPRSIWRFLSRQASVRSFVESGNIQRFFSSSDPGGETCIVLEPMRLIPLDEVAAWTGIKGVRDLPQLTKDVEDLIAEYRSRKIDAISMHDIHGKLLSLIQK